MWPWLCHNLLRRESFPGSRVVIFRRLLPVCFYAPYLLLGKNEVWGLKLQTTFEITRNGFVSFRGSVWFLDAVTMPPEQILGHQCRCALCCNVSYFAGDI